MAYLFYFLTITKKSFFKECPIWIIPMKLKDEFYKCVVRSTMFLGTECWVVDKKIEQWMNVEEMRVIRWMSRLTKENKIINEYARRNIEMVSIVDEREQAERVFSCYEKKKTKCLKTIMKINVEEIEEEKIEKKMVGTCDQK